MKERLEEEPENIPYDLNVKNEAEEYENVQKCADMI